MKAAFAGAGPRARRNTVVARRTSLADALFTGTQQKVLRLLYGQPERSFFANELIELTRSGSGAVQRELARLTDSGLVTSRAIGRQRHYQANPAAPIYEELKRIVVKTIGVVDPLRAAVAPIAGRMSLAIVYGSIAKGSETALSDIDVLVVSDRLLLEDLYRAFEPVEHTVGRKINPTLVKSAEFERRRAERGSFLAKVLAGPVIQLVGDAYKAGRADEAAR